MPQSQRAVRMKYLVKLRRGNFGGCRDARGGSAVGRDGGVFSCNTNNYSKDAGKGYRNKGREIKCGREMGRFVKIGIEKDGVELDRLWCFRALTYMYSYIAWCPEGREAST